jgi:hypothetical protein
MIETASLYSDCGELFANFPLSARHMDASGSIRSMVLILRDGGEARFFILAQSCGDGPPLYSVASWPAGDIADIDVLGRTAVPDPLACAVTRGVPLPRHGSVFGWTGADVITAIVVIYTRYTPERPFPRWRVMPLAGIERNLWPPFTASHFFGSWFWKHYNSGNLVLLDGLIAENPGTVFWVNTHRALGADCCAVARDIIDPDGRILRRGRYVYSEILQAQRPVPSLTALLADLTKTDLAPRFRRHPHVDTRLRC